MRIALITLALVALGFIATIIYTLAWREWMLPKITPKPTIAIDNGSSIEIETLKYQIKTDQKLEELTKKIEKLTGDVPEVSVANTDTSTGRESLPVSGKFLAMVMPTMEFSIIPNAWIFDLHTFDLATTYSTYSDIKYWTVLIVTKLSYEKMLKNFKALSGEVYVTNETKTFPFRSFYVNPPKQDTLVRMVIEIESQAIFIQIPKTKFPTLKALLLKKESTK